MIKEEVIKWDVSSQHGAGGTSELLGVVLDAFLAGCLSPRVRLSMG